MLHEEIADSAAPHTEPFELWGAASLRDWIGQALRNAGLSGGALEVTCESLLEASLTGVDSHGVMLLPLYMRRLREGGIKPDARPVEYSVTPTMSLIDGRAAPGHWSLELAVRRACVSADEFGVGVAGVRNANHVGMLAFFARRIASQGFASILLTNTAPSVSNHAGRGQVIGNNAFCLCLPRAGTTPVISDNATGVVACGKIRWRSELGQDVPLAYGLSDQDGNATSKPSALDRGGAVAPFGGHKGWGLGIMIDLLTAGLWAGEFSRSVSRQRRHAEPQCSTQTVIVLRSAAESPEADARLDAYLGALAELPSSDGRDGHAMLPGEREELTRGKRLRDGIPVPHSIIREVREWLV
jgi:LDH2 family malate/lactate/ureidoglycolate dehydrogenase